MIRIFHDDKQFLMSRKIIEDCAREIAKAKYTISFIESATAGRMCAEFALTQNSGAIIKGGLACYEVSVKEQLLHVPDHLIKEKTPESQEVTDVLAKNGAQLFRSDIAAAVTGLTTAGGSESAEKPVGTMFISIFFNNELLQHREVFEGKAEEIILQTIDKVGILLQHLINK